MNMKNEKGISLVESLLVIVIAGVLVSLLANLPNAMGLINKSRNLSLAREIAVKQIEDKRTISYINLGLGSSPIDDPRISMLPQGSGTVEVGVENKETPDPDDWIPCDISICTNGEFIKQISVTVSWVDNNKPQSITIKTMIAEGGINQ